MPLEACTATVEPSQEKLQYIEPAFEHGGHGIYPHSDQVSLDVRRPTRTDELCQTLAGSTRER